MGRPRRNSKILEAANQRINGLTAIDPQLDFGGGDLTLAKFKEAAQKFDTDLDAYNQMLAQLDERLNALKADEKLLGSFSERMLAAAGARWGKDSSEYEQSGGTRTSERKRRGTPTDKSAPPK